MTRCVAPFQNDVTAMLQSAACLMCRSWRGCGKVPIEEMRQLVQVIEEEYSWNHKAQGCTALFEELCKS